MLIFNCLSHRFGRKATLLVSYVTTAIFGFASAFSYNFTMFAVTRFFTGLGMSGISIITVALCEFYFFFIERIQSAKYSDKKKIQKENYDFPKSHLIHIAFMCYRGCSISKVFALLFSSKFVSNKTHFKPNKDHISSK